MDELKAELATAQELAAAGQQVCNSSISPAALDPVALKTLPGFKSNFNQDWRTLHWIYSHSLVDANLPFSLSKGKTM